MAWSSVKKETFTEQYWTDFWKWYDASGFGHVAAYLRALDLSDFNPKAAPPKTEAFWEIVNANHAPEEAELADAIDRLSKPFRRQDGSTTLDADGEPVLVPPEAIRPDREGGGRGDSPTGSVIVGTGASFRTAWKNAVTSRCATIWRKTACGRLAASGKRSMPTTVYRHRSG